LNKYIGSKHCQRKKARRTLTPKENQANKEEAKRQRDRYVKIKASNLVSIEEDNNENMNEDMNIDDAIMEHADMIETISNPGSTSSKTILNEDLNHGSTSLDPTLNEASNPNTSSNPSMNEALIPITMDTNPGMPLDPPLNDMQNVNMESNLHDIHLNPYFDNVDDIYYNLEEN